MGAAGTGARVGDCSGTLWRRSITEAWSDPLRSSAKGTPRSPIASSNGDVFEMRLVNTSASWERPAATDGVVASKRLGIGPRARHGGQGGA